MTIYIVGPHHRAASSIRSGYDSLVGNINPLSIDAHAIVAVLALPIGVVNALRISAFTAAPFATTQALIPTVQFRVLIIVRASMIECKDGQHSNEDNKRCMPTVVSHL